MGVWGNDVPESCDCCGRDAEDCGMLDSGWVTDSELLADEGVFCRTCAHLLRIARVPERCAWCGAPLPDEETAEVGGWAFYADEIGVLHPCCPACLAARFGIAGRVRLRRDV
jgi:hypothetical protein